MRKKSLTTTQSHLNLLSSDHCCVFLHFLCRLACISSIIIINLIYISGIEWGHSRRKLYNSAFLSTKKWWRICWCILSASTTTWKPTNLSKLPDFTSAWGLMSTQMCLMMRLCCNSSLKRRKNTMRSGNPNGLIVQNNIFTLSPREEIWETNHKQKYWVITNTIHGLHGIKAASTALFCAKNSAVIAKKSSLIWWNTQNCANTPKQSS